jgi:hypothetical protein
LDIDERWHVWEFAIGYLASALLLVAWSRITNVGPPIIDEHEHEVVVHEEA